VLSGEVFSVALRFDEKSVAVIRTSGGFVTVGERSGGTIATGDTADGLRSSKILSEGYGVVETDTLGLGTVFDEGGERWASSDSVSKVHIGVFVGAFGVGDGSGHDLLVPATEEITMVTVTSGISHGPQEVVGSVSVRELSDLVDVLEENSGDTYRVGGGTVTSVGSCSGVSHVRFVVSRVEVLSVPTHGEEDLGTETVGTFVGLQTTPVG